MVLILDRVPDGLCGISLESLLANRVVLADYSDATGRHLVVADGPGRLRVLVKNPHDRRGHAFVVVPDRWCAARAAALSEHLGTRRTGVRSNTQPSRFQRHRLTLMLALLDRFDQAGSEPVTIRELAEAIVYPRVSLGRGIEWKSSSWRRQTQRLLNDARMMADGGYRRLLAGLS